MKYPIINLFNEKLLNLLVLKTNIHVYWQEYLLKQVFDCYSFKIYGATGITMLYRYFEVITLGLNNKSYNWLNEFICAIK